MMFKLSRAFIKNVIQGLMLSKFSEVCISTL